MIVTRRAINNYLHASLCAAARGLCRVVCRARVTGLTLRDASGLNSMGIGSRSIRDLFIHTNASIPPEREVTPSLRINNSPSAFPVLPLASPLPIRRRHLCGTVHAINSPCNNESANDPPVVLIASERAGCAFVRPRLRLIAQCSCLALALAFLSPSLSFCRSFRPQ